MQKSSWPRGEQVHANNIAHISGGDAFDMLYSEGETAPKMMSIGLHCRLSGRPGRATALARFLDYVQQHEKVWLCRRIDIANHWYKHHLNSDIN